MEEFPGVVADTSVVIAFSAIDRIDVLEAVFPRVAIPGAVFTEIVDQGLGWAEARQAQGILDEGTFLQVVEAPSRHLHGIEFPNRLGMGEREVIAYAFVNRIPALLDDSDARRFAISVGLRGVIGSLGIIGKAKKQGVIPRVSPLVAGMHSKGIFFDAALIRRFLNQMGE